MSRIKVYKVLPVVGVLCAAALSSVAPAAASAASAAAVAAPGTVQLFAGDGSTGGPQDGVPAVSTSLHYPAAVTADPAGNVYVAEDGRDLVRRVDAGTGLISTVTGIRRPGADPLRPQAVALDSAGDLYVAGLQNVVELTHDGRFLTLTGPGSSPQTAGLQVSGMAVDPAGGLYLSDLTDLMDPRPRIVRLAPDGTVTLVAGGRAPSYAGDGGPAVAASLMTPEALLVARDGALLVTDEVRVRRIGTDGIISTIAGGGTLRCEGAPARTASLGGGVDLALDATGRLLLSEPDLYRVQRLEADGTLHTLMGQGLRLYDYPPPATLGAPATTNTLDQPTGLVTLPDGRLLVIERMASRVLSIVPGETPGVGRGYAGTGQLAQAGNTGDGGAACGADLAYPTSVARAGDGSTYVADYQNSQIRRITPDGRIATVAGTGLPGFSGDGGPAVAAQLDHPRAVAVDPARRVLIADVVNNRIRRLDPTTGTITTIAGTGQWGSTGDGGPATAAQLAGPHGLTVSPDGTVWVADTGNHTIRRISPDGTISTAAGTGTPGGTGDGGPAAAAQLTSPRSVAVDTQALYLSDPGTRSVRRIDLTTGTISTLAGPTTGTPLSNPASLLPTPAGLLVADAGSNRILRISATGAVSVVAGTGGTGPKSGLVSSIAAQRWPLAQPQGLALEADGTLIVADTAHHQLLRVSPS